MTRHCRRSPIVRLAYAEAAALAVLGWCAECLELARGFVLQAAPGPVACPACGGAWLRPSVIRLLGGVA
jgi:hypothetical protein